MGFGEYPAVSKNVSIKLLCYCVARNWTAQNVLSTRRLLLLSSSAIDYGPESRQAAFEIAELQAKSVLDDELVDTIADMAAQLRAGAHWERNQSRNALQRVGDAFLDLFGEAAMEEREFQHFYDEAEQTREKLRTRWPKECAKVDVLFDLCTHCAWHEQNQVDYDHCLTMKLDGSADGYKEDADTNFEKMQQVS